MRNHPTVKLQNGLKMPMIGLGTWQSSDNDVRRAVEVAVAEAEYPLIDTAELYGNEEIIGDVLQELILEGKIKREDVFITTKLWCNNLHPDRSEAAARECLRRLQLERVDLLLAHMPVARDPVTSKFDTSVTVEDIWRGLEAIYNKGLARAIGVSNFSVDQIERIMQMAKVPIHNAQNEIHLYWPQHELADVCKKHGISLTSYGSLGSPRRGDYVQPNGKNLAFEEAPIVLEDPTVNSISAKYGKSPAQVLLRYLIERGIAVIPKSVTPKRIHENINVFDFELTEAEMSSLNAVPHRQRLFMLPFIKGHPEDSLKSERVQFHN